MNTRSSWLMPENGAVSTVWLTVSARKSDARPCQVGNDANRLAHMLEPRGLTFAGSA